MKKELAKKRLFESLDGAFRKYGADAEMSNPGFHPHYSEVRVDEMRPTWYTLFEFDGYKLYTMYESIEDLCISILFDKDGESKSCLHTGYPKNVDNAREIAKLME